MNHFEFVNWINEAVAPLANSPVHNYIVPGVTSWLIGGHGGKNGTVRMFTSEREHEESVTPHSHRFPFRCLVLTGSVRNRIWSRDPRGDQFEASVMTTNGGMGGYTLAPSVVDRWSFRETKYGVGDTYGMEADAIHSIYFSRGASVLFFEGPETEGESLILQPFVNGKVVPTFKVEDWMFAKETA